MTFNRHFGSASEGTVPTQAVLTDGSLFTMNKRVVATTALVMAVAGLIGKGVQETGHVDPTQIAIKASAADFAKVAPGGGLRDDGTATVAYKYDYEKNEALFMGRQQADIKSGPSGVA